RLVAGVRHERDLLIGRTEARREHELLALAEQAHVEAVLVNARKPLHAPVLRTRFVDEHDARVEVTRLARELLVDLVGDDVVDAAPVLRAGGESLAGELFSGRRVPETELRDDAAVGAARYVADDES